MSDRLSDCIFKARSILSHTKHVFEKLCAAKKVPKMYKVKLRRRNTVPASYTGSRADAHPHCLERQLSLQQKRVRFLFGISLSLIHISIVADIKVGQLVEATPTSSNHITAPAISPDSLS